MRVLVALAAALALTLPGARAQSPGAYAAAAAPDARACARRCADDALCISWLYRANSACELRAIGLGSTEGVQASGLSARAPAFLRTAAPPPAEAASREAAAPAPVPLALLDDDVAAGLLGGPDDGRSGIRPRLRN